MLSSPSAAPEVASRPSLAERAAGGFGASILAGALLGGSAWFSGEQERKGTLAVGQFADFAVLIILILLPGIVLWLPHTLH